MYIQRAVLLNTCNIRVERPTCCVKYCASIESTLSQSRPPTLTVSPFCARLVGATAEDMRARKESSAPCIRICSQVAGPATPALCDAQSPDELYIRQHHQVHHVEQVLAIPLAQRVAELSCVATTENTYPSLRGAIELIKAAPRAQTIEGVACVSITHSPSLIAHHKHHHDACRNGN